MATIKSVVIAPPKAVRPEQLEFAFRPVQGCGSRSEDYFPELMSDIS